MNKVEQFIAVYAPEDDVLFRKRLEQVIQEVKTKCQPTNEAIGMRDYFAAKAMESDIANWSIEAEKTRDIGFWGYEEIAKRAYTMADAMMEARK